MIILLETMFFLALAHFVYESILAPSLRLSLKYKLFALRDEVRMLDATCPGLLDDKHYTCLQDSINTMIAMLHRYDFVTIAATELRYRRDAAFRKRLDMRAAFLDGCNDPQVQSIRRRSIELMGRAVAVNSGMLCAPLYPLALMGIGFSALRKRLKKFATLSRRDLKRIAPDRLGIAIS